MTAVTTELPATGPVPVDIAPSKQSAIVLVDDLETVVESEKCSCNAGDDNPY
ncbi:hypothetical protein [Streptomyces sp. JJ36]|uniref:hypothetical protein n=1 Tax=Streptomyces sp. JJ36 TaxID=2736645 RepID=UPI001F1810BB|nr:hypothetical protein [Streptomyces sp. JJ36]MCF6523779.1 hypothetical protein [Streptomyces sp. JJ36]